MKLGDQNIVPKEFANDSLHEMAGYRNRLTHFYFEVKPDEMYDIVQHHLDDFTVFLKHIKILITNGEHAEQHAA